MKNNTIEKAITERFLSVMEANTGPGKRWKYKVNFAKEMNIRQQELFKLEHGASVQLRHLVQLESITGVNLNWLVCGKGEPYKQEKENGLLQRIETLEKIVFKKIKS